MTDLEQLAIERIQIASDMAKTHHNGEPLVVTYSGGKDSQVLLELFKRSGVPFEVLNNHTTADAPETVRYIREQFKKLKGEGIKATIEYPKYKGKPTSMWKLIRDKGTPPTRIFRYCCEVLKEHGGEGRFIATGVRWAESTRRKNSRGIYEHVAPKMEDRVILNNDNDDRRSLVEFCHKRAKMVVNPIIDWKDKDVWDYIRSEHLDINPLYERGFTRVGCIGCPMAGGKESQSLQNIPSTKLCTRVRLMRLFEIVKRKAKKYMILGAKTELIYSIGGWKMAYCPDR